MKSSHPRHDWLHLPGHFLGLSSVLPRGPELWDLFCSFHPRTDLDLSPSQPGESLSLFRAGRARVGQQVVGSFPGSFPPAPNEGLSHKWTLDHCAQSLPDLLTAWAGGPPLLHSFPKIPQALAGNWKEADWLPSSVHQPSENGHHLLLLGIEFLLDLKRNVLCLGELICWNGASFLESSLTHISGNFYVKKSRSCCETAL